jgi:uncharacterized membrane protein
MGAVGSFFAGFAGRSEQTALLHAAIVSGTTFQRGLLPRTTRDQALVTGTTTALSYGLSITMQSAIDVVARRIAGDLSADDPARRRVALVAGLGAAAVGVGSQYALPEQPHERVPRSVLRTLGRALITTGAAGVIVALTEEAVDRRDGVNDGVGFPVALPLGALGAGAMYFFVQRREQQAKAAAGAEVVDSSEVSAQRALTMGAGVAAALGAVAITERVAAHGIARGVQWTLGAGQAPSRALGHAAAIGMLAGAVVAAYDRALAAQERGADAIEAAYNAPPTSDFVSGGPRSLVPWETLTREGRRFVGMALTRDDIERVMDEPALADPLRLYSGLESADDPVTRVDVLLDEMLHMGAFERSTLCIFAPTGSGYVNYVAAESVEYLTRGDVASVCLQYSKRPSFMSLDRVGTGRVQMRDLLRAISTRLQTMPETDRPRVLLFGESLGAHVSQDAFLHRSVRGLEASGIDSAIWLGTPHASQWRHQVRDENPMPESVAEVASPEELAALGPETLDRLRYCLLTHHEDPIPKFTPKLLVRRPWWLGAPDQRPPGVPRETIWTPLGTFMTVGIDLLNAMNIKPGQFRAFAHDYRSDIRPFVEQVYRLPCDDEQRERIDAALREREARWAKERVIADEMARANEAILKKLGEFGDAVGVGSPG